MWLCFPRPQNREIEVILLLGYECHESGFLFAQPMRQMKI